MTVREIFQQVLRFESPNRVPCWLGGIWDATFDRWHQEGLPHEVDDSLKLVDYFGCDHHIWGAGLSYSLSPSFEELELERNERYVVKRREDGAVVRDRADDWQQSMPQFLEFPVKTREDFEKLRWRLQLNGDHRFPADWKQKVSELNARTVPLFLPTSPGGSFFGSLRALMGLETLLYAFYDDPAWIEEMMDAFADLTIEIADAAFTNQNPAGHPLNPDVIVLWEDMGYKNGPLLSPEMFRRYMLPRYKRVTEHLRSLGIQTIFVDSDGDVRSLIPLWLEGGIDGVLPCEVQAGMDVRELRREFGRDLLILGGIDKKALAGSKETIDAEMDKIAWTIERGGYLPMLDHGLPQDVSFENFTYYVKRLKEVTGLS